MKLILSRKGFDSGSGGVPSPIMPDGRMVSLPIPAKGAPKSYEKIEWAPGRTMGELIRDLAPRVRPEHFAHLDPDLDRNALLREPGWRPLFGQMGASQSHLAKAGVGPGDLFLFFGLFRDVHQRDGRYRYARGAAAHHALFGWLQVAEALRVDEWRNGRLPWATYHPHFQMPPDAGNWLYVAKEHLDIPKVRLGPKGGGFFGSYSPLLRLTAAGASSSMWELPAWFNPLGRSSTLTFHGDAARWSLAGDRVRLRTVGRGQEFVLGVDDYPEALEWLAALFASENHAVGP